jgi:hypothetical protein
MGHIFISYSHRDTNYAHGLANNLQNIGFEIWIDERLDYGSQWPLEIQKQLDSCDAFIIIMTPRSYASEWVQSELQRAKRKLKPIFPLLLEGDEPWLSIESTQFYDVRGEKFPDAKFYSALKRVVSTGSTARTFHTFREAKTVEPVAPPPAPKSRTGIVIAAVSAVAVVCAICGVVSIGLFGSSFWNRLQPAPAPATMTLAFPPTDLPILAVSPTFPPTLSSTATFSPTFTPTETLIPTRTPTETFVPTLPPPPTAAPIAVTNTYNISSCCGDAGTQRSSPIDYTVTIRTVDFLQISFNAAMAGACSDIYLHVLLDGDEVYTTGQIGPLSGKSTTGSIDISPYVSRGKHKLTLSPEGIVGGCNSGTLGGWAGDLIVHTNEFP